MSDRWDFSAPPEVLTTEEFAAAWRELDEGDPWEFLCTCTGEPDDTPCRHHQARGADDE